jgi:hypothetical protein
MSKAGNASWSGKLSAIHLQCLPPLLQICIVGSAFFTLKSKSTELSLYIQLAGIDNKRGRLSTIDLLNHFSIYPLSQVTFSNLSKTHHLVRKTTMCGISLTLAWNATSSGRSSTINLLLSFNSFPAYCGLVRIRCHVISEQEIPRKAIQ